MTTYLLLTSSYGGWYDYLQDTTKTKSAARVRERNIPTEGPPLVGEVSETFADRGSHVVSVTDSLRPYSRFSRPEPQFFFSNNFSIVLTKLDGRRSGPTTSQKDLVVPEIEPGPLDL
jgi:hypothetical protein